MEGTKVLICNADCLNLFAAGASIRCRQFRGATSLMSHRKGYTSLSLLALLTFTGSVASAVDANRGKTLQQRHCSACHAPALPEQSSGYTQAGWSSLVANMVEPQDLAADDQALMAHLAREYPPNQQRQPRPAPGKLEIQFEAWTAPTLGQRVRDPAEAPDGKIWWAGQYGNLLGYVDPQSGAMREYRLPRGAHPHTVLVASDNQVWYTGNKNGTIGRLDPDTGKVTEYAMPNPAARDPHSAKFDAKGRLFFTVQRGNFIGRLDPKTGDIALAEVPVANALPYGIKIDDKGIPWVACNGSNCLIKVDPETMALTRIKLPDANARARRLDIASDGSIWYVNSSLGRLGRYDPVLNSFEEWPTPSGTSSHPYAIAIIDDIVWFNESGMRPDTLVRFDPASEKFQSWPIPSGDIYTGVVRHMRPTANGDLLIHQTAGNRVLRVSVTNQDRRAG